MTNLYIAYGSNMNLEQMAYRCPGAEVVGAGVVHGYRLAFNVHATIKPDEACKVPVLVWKLSLGNEETLDCYEGYPSYYRKEYIDVDINGETKRAMVYIMNSNAEHCPGDSYYQGIAKGYEAAGLDLQPLEEAYDRACNA